MSSFFRSLIAEITIDSAGFINSKVDRRRGQSFDMFGITDVAVVSGERRIFAVFGSITLSTNRYE